MSHLIRKMVALLMLGALLASQVIAAPRILSHSECTMMASMHQTPAAASSTTGSSTTVAISNDHMAVMPEMSADEAHGAMSGHCSDEHEDRCSADHCVSSSAGLIKQHDFAIPSAPQPVADAADQLIPAPVSSPYHPPIIL